MVEEHLQRLLWTLILLPIATCQVPSGGQSTDARVSLLLLPHKPAIHKPPSPKASEFDASIGSELLRVTSVEKARAVTPFRILVMLDLEAISSAASRCAMDELRLIWDRSHGDQISGLFINGSVHMGLKTVDTGRYHYVLAPAPNGATDCSSEFARSMPERSQGGNEASRLSFHGLIESLSDTPGPVSIIWVGQNFHWFEEQTAFTEDELDSGPGRFSDHLENTMLRKIEAMSRGGITVFPLVLPERSRKASDKDARVARKLASMTGARVLPYNQGLAPSLLKAIEEIRDGFIVTVEVPPVPRKRWLVPKDLHIQWKPDPGFLSMTRPFATVDERIAWYLSGWVAKPDRVALFANEIPMTWGCQQTPAGAENLASRVTFSVPRWVADRSGHHLSLNVTPESTGRQRRLIGRTEIQISELPSSNSRAVRFCAQLPTGSQSERLQVVLISDAANWMGIAKENK